MGATATITSQSQDVGGPKTVTGYFTADATTTQETVDLSTYGSRVAFAVSWAEDDIDTGGIEIKETSFSSTSSTITVDHTSPTTTSAVIKFLVKME